MRDHPTPKDLTLTDACRLSGSRAVAVAWETWRRLGSTIAKVIQVIFQLTVTELTNDRAAFPHMETSFL